MNADTIRAGIQAKIADVQAKIDGNDALLRGLNDEKSKLTNALDALSGIEFTIEKSKPTRRKRRTREEIEADEAKAAAEPKKKQGRPKKTAGVGSASGL